MDVRQRLRLVRVAPIGEQDGDDFAFRIPTHLRARVTSVRPRERRQISTASILIHLVIVRILHEVKRRGRRRSECDATHPKARLL